MSASGLRSLTVIDELTENALTQNDFTDYVRYHSIAYQKLEQTNLDSYSIHIYQVIALSGNQYTNQFVIYVVPTKSVSYALTIDDENDQTKAFITNKNTTDEIFNTENNDYKDKAISFGIEKFGFYYYVFYLNDSQILDIKLYDYNGLEMLNIDIDYIAIDYNPTTSNLALGYSREELESLLDLNNYVRPLLIKNITIFLTVDILLGGIIVFIIKKKNRK
jgi:hypothetical protein